MFNQTAKQLFGYEQVAEADCEYPIDYGTFRKQVAGKSYKGGYPYEFTGRLESV